MRKYLGSKMSAFFAVTAVPLFILGPIFFGIVILSAKISIATVILLLSCVLCSVIWTYYIYTVSDQMYSWGTFTTDSVRVIIPFRKKRLLVYEKCRGCGIGFYTHGILNSPAGTRIYFIYLSYERFDEAYRSNINLWKPSETRIKIQFNEKLYKYLLTVLPPKQAHMLLLDYEKYIK